MIFSKSLFYIKEQAVNCELSNAKVMGSSGAMTSQDGLPSENDNSV